MSEDAQTPQKADEPAHAPESSESSGVTGQHAATGAGGPSGGVRYSERLYAAWWCWPLPLIAGVLLAAEVHLGYAGVRSWLPYVVAVGLVVPLMLWLGRVRVRVADGELWVGAGDPAHLPLRFADEIEIVEPRDKREALGPGLDPAAFVLHRAWVGPMVRVHLTDPDDPTPYWLISTRSPGRLAELISEERDAPR